MNGFTKLYRLLVYYLLCISPQVQLLQGQPHPLPPEMWIQPCQGFEVHALLWSDRSWTSRPCRGDCVVV